MSEKRKQIMEVALRCFSRSGFEATSIQEIAQELGMAKGSIYFYFKSKEELLLSVLAYFGEKMMSGLTQLPEERQLPPRERLLVQVRRFCLFVTEHREFPLMVMREPAVLEHKHAKIEGLTGGVRRRFLRWIVQHIDDIYGREAYAYATDGAALFGGMLMEYMRQLMIGRKAIDSERLAAFLVARLDDAMRGMMRSQAEPILPRQDSAEESEARSAYEEAVRAAARELRYAVERASPSECEEDLRADLLAALNRFEAEFAKPIPDRIVLKGMLAYLREAAIPAVRPDVERLEAAMVPHR